MNGDIQLRIHRNSKDTEIDDMEGNEIEIPKRARMRQMKIWNL